jgi:hypothetical protein
MRFDVQNQVCSAQAFTGAATNSEDAIKKPTAAEDPSIGRRLAYYVVPTVAQGAGSTMTIEAVQADDAALTTNREVIATLSGVLAASATVGEVFEVPIPQGVMTRMYQGLRVTLTGGTTTVTLDAYLMPQDEIPKFKTFPKVNDALV